jgi:hypothetical protein
LHWGISKLGEQLDPFWLQFAAVGAATGVIATIVEHTRKFSDSPLWAKRGRGWTFFGIGTFGMLVLPLILMEPGILLQNLGFTAGFAFPFIAGFVYLLAAARSESDKPYYQIVRDLFRKQP